MSHTVIDAATLLSSWIRRVGGMYAKDLKALPEAAYTTSIGGACRTAHDFTAEVAGFNYMLVGVVSGAEMPPRDEAKEEAFKASLSTIEAGAQAVLASSEALAAAVETAGDKLNAPFSAPWGEEMPLAMMVNIAANHIMYHDGQLTYLQSFHGDTEMHWFD